MNVSIIFVNYKTKEMTAKAIESVIDKTSGIKYEIFVVDNCSADDSVEYLNEKFGKKIQLIASEKNLGFGRGNNLAIKKAAGKYVFLLNTDTLLINNAVKILFDLMEQTETAGACGGNLYRADGITPTMSFHSFPKTENPIKKTIKEMIRKFYFWRKIRSFNFSGEIMKVDYITGADIMLRKSALDKVGLFDEDFFMYAEEAELSYRLKKSGWDSFSVPDAKIIHYEGGSQKSKEAKFRSVRILHESKYLYFSKTTTPETTQKCFKDDLKFLTIKMFIQPWRIKYYSTIKREIKKGFKSYQEKLPQISQPVTND